MPVGAGRPTGGAWRGLAGAGLACAGDELEVLPTRALGAVDAAGRVEERGIGLGEHAGTVSAGGGSRADRATAVVGVRHEIAAAILPKAERADE